MSTNVKDGVIRVDQLQMRHPPTCVDCTRKGKRKGRYVVHICAHRVSGLFCGRCVDRLEAEWDKALSGREEARGGSAHSVTSPRGSTSVKEASAAPASRPESARRVAA